MISSVMIGWGGLLDRLDFLAWVVIESASSRMEGRVLLRLIGGELVMV